MQSYKIYIQMWIILNMLAYIHRRTKHFLVALCTVQILALLWFSQDIDIQYNLNLSACDDCIYLKYFALPLNINDYINKIVHFMLNTML